MRAVRADVCAEMDKLAFVREKYAAICGVGGTIRAAARLANDLFGLSADNREITYENLRDILRLFRKSKQLALQSLLRTAPERVHTLIPGMTILKTVAKRFGSDVIVVSGYGVREGYLYERVLGGKTDAAADA